METARRFITAIRRGDLECQSSGTPRGMMAAAVTGKAAFGDWRTDAPLVRRKITDLPPPYAT